MPGGATGYALGGERALTVHWRLGDGSRLALAANLADQPAQLAPQPGRALYLSDGLDAARHAAGRLPPWSVAWTLADGPS